MTTNTGKRDSKGFWVIPKIEYQFECQGCGKLETRLRHPSGGKAKLCKACKWHRQKIRDALYNSNRDDKKAATVVFISDRGRRHA